MYRCYSEPEENSEKISDRSETVKVLWRVIRREAEVICI